MVKKTVTFTNLYDEEETRTLYFNLSTDELIGIVKNIIPAGSDPQKYLEDFINDDGDESKKFLQITLLFEVIRASYGEVIDSVTFDKNEERTNKFMDSIVYDALLDDLFSSEESVTDFFSKLVPKIGKSSQMNTPVTVNFPSPRILSPEEQLKQQYMEELKKLKGEESVFDLASQFK